MPITQLIPGALPGRRYGVFDRASAPHPVIKITQLIPSALPGRRYGSFAGRGVGFPAQFAGLRIYYAGSTKELCLVAVADAPTGMGGQIFIDKNGTAYAIYLVETTDPNASSVRFKTTTGTKAVRLKT